MSTTAAAATGASVRRYLLSLGLLARVVLLAFGLIPAKLQQVFESALLFLVAYETFQVFDELIKLLVGDVSVAQILQVSLDIFALKREPHRDQGRWTTRQ